MNFTHTRLLISDMAVSVRFYRDALGFTLQIGSESDVYTELKAGEHVLALFTADAMAGDTGLPAAAPGGRTLGKVIICLDVPNVDEAYQALVAKGVTFAVGLTDRPMWGVRTAHLFDPDGNVIEISHGIPMAG